MFTTITNCAKIEYQTDSDGLQHTITTSPCTALVSTVDLTLQIMCNKEYVEVGEEFSYTFLFTNMTPVTLAHVVCQDILNPALTYVENSMTYNCVSLEKTTFDTSLVLPDLLPLQSAILQFKVYAHELPSPTSITNSYALRYDAIVADPVSTIDLQQMDLNPVDLDEVQSEIKYSDMVITYIGKDSLLLEHVPDSFTLIPNMRLHLTGTITNAGNTDLHDTFIRLQFPDGTSYVPDSFYVNGVPVPITTNNTFFIGTVPSQTSFSYYYDFQVEEEVPEGNLTSTAIAEGTNSDLRSPHPTVTSNQVINTYTYAAKPSVQPLILKKSANYCNIEYGDTFTYCLSIYNPNDYGITNLCLKDNLACELSYLPNSMMINATNSNLSTFTGELRLPDLGPKESHHITFSVRLTHLPSTCAISNFFTLDYASQDCSLPQQCTDQSNVLILSTSQSKLLLQHTPDRFYLCGDEDILYTGKVTNLSNCNCLTTYISLHFPEGSFILLDSVRVNDQPACLSPNSELYMGDLSPGETATYDYILHLTMLCKDSLFDSAVAYGYPKGTCSSHPVTLSNTVVNTFTLFVEPVEPPLPSPLVKPTTSHTTTHPTTSHTDNFSTSYTDNHLASYITNSAANNSAVAPDNLFFLCLLLCLLTPSS